MARATVVPTLPQLPDSVDQRIRDWCETAELLLRNVQASVSTLNATITNINNTSSTTIIGGSTGSPVFFDSGDGGDEPFVIPGPMGHTGDQGPIGDPVYLEGPEGEEGALGPVGPKGDTGASGPVGPVVTVMDGDEGPWGPPGVRGLTGDQGPVGLAVYLDAPEGEPGEFVVGPQGRTGDTGATGPAVYLEAERGDDGDTIVGPKGDTGAQGPNGPATFLDAPDGEPGEYVIGPRGPTGDPGPAGPPIFLAAPDGDQGDPGLPIASFPNPSPQRTVVDPVEIVEIYSGESLVVAGPYNLNGRVNLSGTLMIL